MAKGFKTGGRVKGSVNKKITEAAAKVRELGITPLEYMLEVMRQPIPEYAEPAEKALIMHAKIDAAKAAAPYVHPKLSSVEVSAEVFNHNVSELTESQLINIATAGSEGDSSEASSEEAVH